MSGEPDTATIEIADWTRLPASPVVSVYMLAYKHEKFIAEAIEGVIAQQCDFPIELIIGDDCSPDRTGEIARDYQRRYPQLIRILTASRNVGAQANSARCRGACRGEYVAICEGDDYWHHARKLQMQVDLMRAEPRMVMCHTDFNRITKFRLHRNVHQTHRTRWLAKGKSYESLLIQWSVMTCTSMYREDVLRKFATSPYCNANWPFGDLNLLLFSSLRGIFGYIKESTATFRRTRGSAGNSGNLAHLRMSLATEECVEMFISHHPPSDEIALLARATLKRRIQKFAFFQGDVRLLDACTYWLRNNHQTQSPYGWGISRKIASSSGVISFIRYNKEFLDRMLSD